jgi:hypothetical protein
MVPGSWLEASERVEGNQERWNGQGEQEGCFFLDSRCRSGFFLLLSCCFLRSFTPNWSVRNRSLVPKKLSKRHKPKITVL